MKLYVKDVIREPKDTLYTFLYKVLRLNDEYYKQTTVNTTYLDPEFKEQQCISGKNRSFDDLVYISKTYFKISDKVIAKTIKRILDENKVLFVLCDNVNKWVLNRNLTLSNNIKYCGKYNKSDCRTNDCGVGNYSFDDIITLMELTKEDIKINN